MQNAIIMKNTCRLAGVAIRLAGLVFAMSLSAVAEDSPVRTAPLRLRIEPAPNSAWPADMGTVELAPCLKAPGPFGVFTAAGKPVAFQIYWSANGEPVGVRFDTSGGATSYYICFATNLPPAPGIWKPEAGLLVETRACAEQPVNTFPQVSQLLEAAGPPQGRDYMANIFLGMNPFGPSSFYIASFSGWFNAPMDGSYRFATVSTDASWLQIDGQTVVEWLGKHGYQGGRRGEHAGDIQLRAGRHRLDYAQIQFDGEAAAEAAWQPPGAGHFETIPASAFVPVATFRAASLESATEPGPLYFEWRTAAQCALGDTMALRVRFHVVDNSQRRNYRWRFDDGADATGMNPEHYFPQPGLRQVTLEAWERGLCVATNIVRIRVAPDWLQRDWWRNDIFNAAKIDFLQRDLSRTPARDLEAIIDLADRADDRELLTRAGEAMVRRADEFKTAADGVAFYKLGIGFEHQGDAGDALAEKSFRLALAPERDSSPIADKVKLRLSGLLIHWSGQFDEAEKLLAGISGNNPAGDEKRLRQLLQGDLLLARGKIEAARKQYLAVGGQPDKKNAGTATAARLEGASILIEHGQFDDAQDALDRLAVEIPAERMSLDTGLLQIQLELQHKEFQRAFTACRLLSPVAENDPRLSEILYATVESGLDLGKTGEARLALAQLLKDFPYSEAAAKAKDKWP
jgi:predicted negative regulator of RcsB-dependent stress response